MDFLDARGMDALMFLLLLFCVSIGLTGYGMLLSTYEFGFDFGLAILATCLVGKLVQSQRIRGVVIGVKIC